MKLANVLIVFLGLVCAQVAVAGQYYQADDGAGAADDHVDAAEYAEKYYGGDDGNKNYYNQNGFNYNTFKGDYKNGEEIVYWTEFAIQPRKCITYGKKDMIVFSMYEKYYNHCKDTPIGTYMVDVPTFITNYVEQMDLNAEDKGNNNYESPDTTYVNCYPYETNNGVVSWHIMLFAFNCGNQRRHFFQCI